MSYALYIGKNHTADGHAYFAGYGDEPSSHWLEIIPRNQHPDGATVTVGVSEAADLPGVRTEIPQAKETARHIRVSYSYYMGVPAPITNGGLNEHGVAVRDVWSTSRAELIAMTPADQTGLNYSDLARMVLEQAKSAREGVELIGDLIAQYGESSYGGNSHLIADANEAWVVIQFAGGKGLWCAERLGDDAIRASRPGYIEDVPIDEPDHPDFLYSENFISFAKEQGWYSSGRFNANNIYGDGKGRWEGVQWIEAEMLSRASRPEKISLSDIIWALRTPKLTGDTAGYGQIIPLKISAHDDLRMLWHAAIGPVAAPFAPVFIGQEKVPPEYAMHRYLTVGEAHRFMDTRKLNDGAQDALSLVSQQNEMYRSAVYEAKRLFYLMLQDGQEFTELVHEAFEQREGELEVKVSKAILSAGELMEEEHIDEAATSLENLSLQALKTGHELVMELANKLEARVVDQGAKSGVLMYDQIW